jgi:hypothetical protein
MFPLREAAAAPVPPSKVAFWHSVAPTCIAPSGFRFPSKFHDSECDDGDVVLFAGLLCAAGEQIGCETVRLSQSIDGRWYRSPRRAATENLGHPNSFSPDMALGMQLYWATKNDKLAAEKWLSWLDNARTCWIGSGPNCVRSPFYRLCPDDNEQGCTIQPGGTPTILYQTVRFLGVDFPTEDMNRFFQQDKDRYQEILWLESQVNAEGYSQHLVASKIFLLRKIGINSNLVVAASVALSAKQPKNPFFAYLAEGPTARVRDMLLTLCPANASEVPAEKTQWAWERHDGDEAWKKSMIWDCIFMARLLEGST